MYVYIYIYLDAERWLIISCVACSNPLKISHGTLVNKERTLAAKTITFWVFALSTEQGSRSNRKWRISSGFCPCSDSHCRNSSACSGETSKGKDCSVRRRIWAHSVLHLIVRKASAASCHCPGCAGFASPACHWGNALRHSRTLGSTAAQLRRRTTMSPSIFESAGFAAMFSMIMIAAWI